MEREPRRRGHLGHASLEAIAQLDPDQRQRQPLVPGCLRLSGPAREADAGRSQPNGVSPPRYDWGRSLRTVERAVARSEGNRFAGHRVKPILVTDGPCILDGFHRAQAHREAGRRHATGWMIPAAELELFKLPERQADHVIGQ